jgi:hypothetical protein
MKKFLITLLFFGCLFFIADKVLYLKMQSLPEREYDKRLESIILGKMNQEILIFGSSRAQHNIYSDLLQDSLKQKTYNLGYRGCNINFQLFLLKKVLEHNQIPKTVLLTVDDYNQFLPEKTLQFRFDKLYPLVKYQEITSELIQRKEISPFSFGFISARIGWEQFTKTKAKTLYDEWTPKGTVLLDFQASDFDKIRKEEVMYHQKNEIPDRIKAFTEFQEICLQNNIKLHIVIPPNFAKQNKSFVKRIKKLISNKKVNLIHQNSDSFNNSNLFSDYSHLNKKGAIIYTNFIINQLKHKDKSLQSH